MPGEVVTISFHIGIQHSLLNWDLWSNTEGLAFQTTCVDQAGTWITIQEDYPPTCINGSGAYCGPPGGCLMEYLWTVPDIESDQVKIRIKMDNSSPTDYWDVSDGTFTIASPTSVPEELARRGFALEQNHPNPFNPKTTISYVLEEEGVVRLTLHDAKGRLVKLLANEVAAGGPHRVEWNGTNEWGSPVSSGVYFYTLETARGTSTRKLLLSK